MSMNVALYGKNCAGDDIPYLQSLFDRLGETGGKVFVYQPFLKVLQNKIRFASEPKPFTEQKEINHQVDYLFSIGGDGTLLDTIPLVGNSNIPILGINMGRLGFLSGISKDEILVAIDDILLKKYDLDQRTLLRLDSPQGLFGPYNYALNDLTVYRGSLLSILNIRVFINDEFLNTYWADGLIVATPTGSTAYSLSCTGPIITPDSENFVITPIASHNLTVRPIVVPDKSVIRIVVEGRGLDCYAGLDSRNKKIDNSMELVIRKEDFKINLLRMRDRNFFHTIREKLNWGRDIRN
jgi:NAD+ kinase